MAAYSREADATRVVIVDEAGVESSPDDVGVPLTLALVTPDDNNDISGAPYRYFSFGTAGAVALITSAGTSVTIPSGALSPGLQHALSVSRIKSTGTTATGFVVYK